MIKEPIYNAVLFLSLSDAWYRIVEFSKEYSVKIADKNNNILVLDISYPIRIFTYSTWAERVIISLRPLSNGKTRINIYGNVLLSPHHFFRLIALNRKKIDKNTLTYKVQIFFRKYETMPTAGTGHTIGVRS